IRLPVSPPRRCAAGRYPHRIALRVPSPLRGWRRPHCIVARLALIAWLLRIALRALNRRPARLTAMPDEEQAAPPADEPGDTATPDDGDAGGPTFSPYGIASAALGALCVAAIALGAVIWTHHRSDVDERSYQTRAMQAAA